MATTYTITEPGSGTWGDGMSIETWRANEAGMGANGDVYNFTTPQTTASYPFTSLLGYHITHNNVTLNAAAPSGAAVRLLGTSLGGQAFIIEDATGVVFNGLRISNPNPSGIEWGVSSGVNTPTGIVNDVIVSGSNNQSFQHLANSSVVYNDSQGNNSIDDGQSLHDGSTVVDNGGSYTGNGQGITVVHQGNYTGNGITSTGNTRAHVQISGDVILGSDSASDTGINATFNDSTVGNITGISENAAVDITLRFNRGNILCDTLPAIGTLTGYARAFIQMGGNTASNGDVDAIFDSVVVHAPLLAPGGYTSQCYFRGVTTNITKFRNCNLLLDLGLGFGIAMSAVSGAGLILENTDFFGCNTGINFVTSSSGDNSSVSNCNFDSDSVFAPFATNTPAVDVDNTTDPSGYTDVSNINDPDLHPALGSTLITGGNDSFLPSLDNEGFVFQSLNRAAFAFPQISSESPTLTTPYPDLTFLAGQSINIDLNPNITGNTSPLVVAVIPELQGGLSEDAAIISGTAIVPTGTATVTVTGTNSFGSVRDRFQLTTLTTGSPTSGINVPINEA